MKISGWGQNPVVDAQVRRIAHEQQVLQLMTENEGELIARGLGRSYGDSSLATTMLSMTDYDHLISFDEQTGVLVCAAGVSLSAILRVFVPKGWFLPVTPGTRYVTVGGAIASDVHGKNHHVDGCFSEFVESVTIATVSSGLVECSRQQHAELFHATCGGMGLTGVIVTATIRLNKIRSAFINERIIKTHSLEQTLDLFEQHQQAAYSVAWIDCMASGEALGRSLLMLGDHSEDGDLQIKTRSKLTVPFNLPSQLLNPYTIRAFNTLYYHRIRATEIEKRSTYESFFYPLDGINNWNRMYGKNGFAQYQFVIPEEAGKQAMKSILQTIADSKRGSFLAVLKLMGKQNSNPLSFPQQGYTLALDFKMEHGLDSFLSRLDQQVLEFGGRVYLSKDARLPAETFRSMYPEWERFMQVRQDFQADKLFHSLQSRRLGL